MIYFDSDVLVHYFYKQQDPSKQVVAQREIESAVSNEQAAVSVISLQETAFVLSKLKVPAADIHDAIEFLKDWIVLPATSQDFYRAKEFVNILGFQNINDCLHTAIAEKSCLELKTFNVSDFKRIQSLTSLKINIL